MLQKKAFAGKQLAAKPVQVRSVGLAHDPVVATRIARLRPPAGPQQLTQSLAHVRSACTVVRGSLHVLLISAKRTPRTRANPTRCAAGWRQWHPRSHTTQIESARLVDTRLSP
jgi:hypothetical protein